MNHSNFHRGDYRRVRRSVTVELIELEALEPRMQLAYKYGEIPAEAVADLSLARLMAEELDKLLRGALDRAISSNPDVYADATYDARKLVGRESI